MWAAAFFLRKMRRLLPDDAPARILYDRNFSIVQIVDAFIISLVYRIRAKGTLVKKISYGKNVLFFITWKSQIVTSSFILARYMPKKLTGHFVSCFFQYQ